MLRNDEIYADDIDDCYNGESHRLMLAGTRHSVRTSSEFRFAVGEKLPPKPTPPAGTTELPESMKDADYSERSRAWAVRNSLPAGNIERQTDAERREIIERNEQRYKLTLPEDKPKKKKFLLAAPKGAC